ncbi:hypothetical protein KDA_42200 [Dictyobacter alpinus]|uniref:Uncharacterized protein n=1 Tax=Dictyobacter alpinus TaxID=2014873 RepID=A0A402BBP2_9CHLR|nr:DUF5984 family protein [Dictyobacter alpinus]GCE28736.1 hypothetical protein KDA_42200 [Dictyobacter alpinus]
MFFHFQLHPIAEIKPWGGKEEPVLHWFGLSDGWYWFQIGETEIFRYSKPFLAAYPPIPHPPRPYIDYYVVRLWEDILEIVPDIIDPLPAPLLQRMESIDQWLNWCKKAEKWREDAREMCSEEESDARGELLSTALEWWWRRHLYTGPFIITPGMHFWSDGQIVHCLWDTRQAQFADDQFIWEAIYGTKAIPVTTFMEAVTSFNERFIAAMAERVNTVLTNWSRPEITIDFAHLAREHVQRSEHFASRMAEVPTRARTATAWEQCLEAIKVIENDTAFQQE